MDISASPLTCVSDCSLTFNHCICLIQNDERRSNAPTGEEQLDESFVVSREDCDSVTLAYPQVQKTFCEGLRSLFEIDKAEASAGPGDNEGDFGAKLFSLPVHQLAKCQVKKAGRS